MEFSASILPGFGAWMFDKAGYVGATLTIYPGGSAYCIVYPRDTDEAKQRSHYQLQLNQEGTPGQLRITYDTYHTAADSSKKASTLLQGKEFNTVIETGQHTLKRSVFTIVNTSDQVVNIVNVKLRPELILTDDLQNALTRYETHIVKYTNLTELSVNTEKTLIANLNVELSEVSDLLVHLMINGVASEDTTLNLAIYTNQRMVDYCPLQVDIKQGNFIVGLPLNLMKVPTGENRIKVYLIHSNGTLTIPTKKIQFTLDGQSMVAIYGEDVWFGPSEENDYDPCTNEAFVFEDNVITYIDNGQLNVNIFAQVPTEMIKKQTLKKGIVYEHTFYHNKVKQYEEVTII